jgi:hypothetical protein
LEGDFATYDVGPRVLREPATIQMMMIMLIR